MVIQLGADLDSHQGTGQGFRREGQVLGPRRQAWGGDGRLRRQSADDGRGVPDGFLELGDGVLWDLVDRNLREEGHHRAAVALRVDDGRCLRPDVDVAWRRRFL